MKKALFLDRDGVLNIRLPDARYVTKAEEFEWAPGARELIRFAKDAGFLVCVITNQQGVGKWLYSLADLSEIHGNMQSDLRDVRIDAFYVCPHLSTDNCVCRKPKPGLLLQAMEEWSVDPENALFIGDSGTDMDAGHAAGVETLLIESDNLLHYSAEIRAKLIRISSLA